MRPRDTRLARRSPAWLTVAALLLVLAGFLAQMLRGDCPVP